MRPRDLLIEVIRPTLEYLGMGGKAAENLLLGTAAAESGFKHLIQIGGPARGLWQMEPATCRDIRDNYLRYHTDLMERVKLLRHQVGLDNNDPWSAQLTGNLYFACAMARLQYRRYPEVLPDHVAAQADLWKLRYNTPLGAGTTAHYVRAWNSLVVPHMGE